MFGAVLVASLVALVGAGSASAKGGTPAPSLFKGSASSLLPDATTVGSNEMTKRSGGAKRATATYSGPSTWLVVRVFASEAAARATYAATCTGCKSGTVAPQKWVYKLRYFKPQRTVVLAARCRNVVVGISREGGADKAAHRSAKLAIWPVFDKAVRLGMTQCGSSPKPPPTTGTYFWTEDEAQARVLRKVRIPACRVQPKAPECETRVGVALESAVCRGLDEKPGTFTFSRFTCDVVTRYYYGKTQGRLAIWPTGPTSLRWEII